MTIARMSPLVGVVPGIRIFPNGRPLQALRPEQPVGKFVTTGNFGAVCVLRKAVKIVTVSRGPTPSMEATEGDCGWRTQTHQWRGDSCPARLRQRSHRVCFD